jgi:hypothetical protein
MSHSDILPEKALIKCFKILDMLEIGQKIFVSDYARFDPDLFIQCCKQYYDCYRNLRFSDDYNEIQKIERDLTFKEIENLFG